MEFRPLSQLLLMLSLAQSGLAQDVSPILSADPPGPQIFSGETVKLTCLIPGWRVSAWRYYWQTNGQRVHSSDLNYYIIRDLKEQSHTYKCYGTSDYGGSQWSNEVTLTVIERPKATLYPVPDRKAFSGERVTLTCVIQGDMGSEWRYMWSKEGYSENPFHSSGEKTEYSLHVVESDSGVYTCKGQRKQDSQSSKTSDAVKLTVSAVKPKPELTSSLQGAALIGNPVTLYCKLEQSAGWRFYWSKHTQNPENETSTETSSTTISSVTPSDGDQYWCRAGRGNPVYYTHYSDALWVNITVRPKAVVILIPDEQVFRGENVTLRCNIQGGDYNWTYRWFKDGSNLFSWDTSQTFNIRSVTEAYGGKYTCRGERSDSQSSDTSDARTLTVSAKPQAVLSMFPQSWLAEGDPVTLSCEVRGSSTGWTFSWYRYEHTLLSDSIRGAGGSYTVSSAAVNHTGVYVCRAERGKPAYQTHYSNPQTLWVTGVSSIVSLIISPNRSQHFSGQSLSLSCEDQSNSTTWTVMQHTHSGRVSDCSSGGGSVTGSTCVYNVLYKSHTGVYWCQSESGVARSPVNITVHNGKVILDSPVHVVTEGDHLTLRCLYSFTKSSNLRADFYKDGLLILNQTTGEMMIHKVSKSDEGLYHCKHPERGESPHSWVLVKAGESPGLVGLTLWLTLALVFIILLTLVMLCCYQINKGGVSWSPPFGSRRNTTQEKSEIGAVEGCQSACTEDLADTHIYDTAEQTDISGQDSGAVCSDVTYADIELKVRKKATKKQEMASANTDTVYSELKNTGKGETAGCTEPTYYSIN
ncbi:cell adhesion molecule CEACAM5-like isoform X2 [Brachyhypopomus gauderio]|uniref:cell adhesion molecule CEACAM5-like isoform X2 n=1 Tax=Brachyhypopomus gauderio TaxID=698409 RepID=UPI004041EA47